MSLYLDSSALLAVLLDEPTSRHARETMAADPLWVTARHTAVEVRRNLARLLTGSELTDRGIDFRSHWERTRILELDSVTCELAAQLAESTLVRTMDAMHLAAAQRVGSVDLTMLTYDRRLAQVASAQGMLVLGWSDVQSGGETLNPP